ncbi:sugar ABC transporter substrate-binding protein [Bacillaceae bacterium S4-13-58]
MLMVLLSVMFIAFVTGCNVSSDSNESNANNKKIEGVPEAMQGDVKVAVIRNLPSDDHTKQFLDGARNEGEAFGFKVDTFISDGDDARFQDLVRQAIQKDYDGLVISHGKASYSYDMIKPALDKGIKVVTFDTAATKDGKTLEGITSTAQNDHKLAEMSLDELIEFAGQDGPPKIIKITIGGIVPLDKRDEIYTKYEEEGKIVTLEEVGPQNMQNVQGDVTAAINSVLSKYGEGEVDAIWAAWDELAKGAYNAMKDNNRMDVKLISIDISNQDINLMREEGSSWMSTAAVDPHLIGVMDMRLLAKKIAGEETPESYELEPSVIKQEELTTETNMTNLGDVIKGWGISDDHNEDWMKILREKNN